MGHFASANSSRGVDPGSAPVLNTVEKEEKRIFTQIDPCELADISQLSEIFARLEKSPLAGIFPDTRDSVGNTSLKESDPDYFHNGNW